MTDQSFIPPVPPCGIAPEKPTESNLGKYDRLMLIFSIICFTFNAAAILVPLLTRVFKNCDLLFASTFLTTLAYCIAWILIFRGRVSFSYLTATILGVISFIYLFSGLAEFFLKIVL